MRALVILRSLVGIILFPLITAFFSIGAIIEVYTLHSKPFEDRWVQAWGAICTRLFGVKIKEKGRENLVPGACLYLFNHTSFFDIFVMSARLPGVRFGAKIQLFSIPFFGLAMKRFGVLPIARENRKQVFKVYEWAKKQAAKGQQYALAPEGKRNHSENESLLPFKTGPFVFAINAQVPIVPVIIKGAREIMPKGSFLPNSKHIYSEITIEYLPSVSVQGFSYEQRHELQQKVYDMMIPHFTA